jgi:hypothetical protein
MNVDVKLNTSGFCSFSLFFKPKNMDFEIIVAIRKI